MSSDIKQRLLYRNASTPQDAALDDLAIARIEALEAEVERLRAALEAIAVRAGTFEGRGSYIAYVELAGEIEKMADAARNGEKP